MLIILLALHSNSDYEECLSYVGTEGNAKLSVYSVNAEQRHLISVGRAKVRKTSAPQRVPYDVDLIQSIVLLLIGRGALLDELRPFHASHPVRRPLVR